MFFKLAEIKGFKRVSLNKIEKITIEFDKKFHCFLGTNGAGKTSLMRELSPLAAIPSAYHKGGYKKLVVAHQGYVYVLLSDFSGPKNIFSMVRIKDGVSEELNPGHTSTVFNNLVLQHFRYTKEIHEFSLGLRNFTEMSGVERKNWLTKWSDADYSFALSYFQKLYASFRDLQGSIKTDQNRLLEAKAKLVSPDHLELLKGSLGALKEKRNFLMEIIPRPESSPDTVEFLRNGSQARISRIRKDLRKLLVENQKYLPIEDTIFLEERRIRILSEINFQESASTETMRRLQELSLEIGELSTVQNLDNKVLTEETTEALRRIREYEKLRVYQECQDPNEALLAFPSWIAELGAIVPLLITDHDGDLNNDNLIVYKERLARAESFIEHSEGAIEEYTRKLNDAKDCGHDASVECPSCKHSWVPGKTPADIHKLETLLNEIREKRKKALEVKESLTEDVKKQMDFANGLRYLTNFVQEHPLFRNFWEQIYSEKVHTKEPETLMNRALRYKEDLEACKQLAALRELVENNNRKIESLKALDQLSLAKCLEEKEVLEKKLEDIYLHREKLWKEKQELEYQLALEKTIRSMKQEAENQFKVFSDNTLEALKHDERRRLSELLFETEREILVAEKEIRGFEIQQGQIDMLESNVQESQEFAKVMKVAVDSLSPSKGLIAKGLVGFINHLVAMVNGIIAKVWLYPMEIRPILPDENDNISLEYKFEVSVNGEDTPDIYECSSGQKEIINRAFQIVGLAFMRLDHGPLFLDEFGARMDTAHKASAFDMITKLLVDSNFSQVFMVSHFEGTHIQNVDADITVLCGANIQLPPGVGYNQVTTIE